MDAFRWLHLTDLHWGQTGQRHLWPEIRKRFLEDLARLHPKTGAWDAVLFTGDLVFRGDLDEFAELDGELFGPLWKFFHELGSNPVLLTVPGNHDLKRPNEKDDDAAVDRLLEPEGYQKVAEKFWANQNNQYRRAVDHTFEAYEAWIKDRPYSQGHPIHPGALPGDFSTTLTTVGGRRIGIVGLNTTFLQLAAGDYRGRLACDVRQFNAACPSDAPTWVEDHAVCLLMTHQGPDWLDQPSRDHAYSQINPAGRFAIHLYGHMHEEVIRGYQHRGGPLVRHWQGNSLFGLEHYGDQKKQDRRHGYAAGTIEFDEQGGAVLRHWPQTAIQDRVNGWRFDRDGTNCILQDDGGTKPESILEPAPSGSPGSPKVVVPTKPSPKLIAQQLGDNYGRWVADAWENSWAGEVK